MKKTISILSVFTVSFFYSQDNNNDIKNENNNQIISKKDFNITYENRNIIKIENQKPIHIEMFQYNNKEYKIKKNNSLNDLNLSIFNKNYDELREKIETLNSENEGLKAESKKKTEDINSKLKELDKLYSQMKKRVKLDIEQSLWGKFGIEDKR